MTTQAAISLRLPGAGAAGPRDIPMEESQLIDGMLAGDERAFDLFSDRFIPALYRFAFFRLNQDRELTCDIVQSTVCKAIAKLSSFRGEAALMTWLCACCRSEIAMHFRKQSRRPYEVELNDESFAALPLERYTTQAEPEGTLLSKEKHLHVHMVLDLVSPRYRQVLAWKYLEDLPVKEIATRLAIGPKAAESLLTRARRSFRVKFDHLLESRSGDDSQS